MDFFDIQGIVQKQFIPPGQPVNGSFYCEVLKQLREDIQHKHPDTCKNNWFLRHDNAHAHFTCSTIHDLQKHCSDSPSHSTDFTPWDHFLFPQMKLRLKRCRFDTQNYKSLSTDILELPRTHEVGSTLGSLYTCPRGLLWRRRWKLGVMVRSFFLMVKFLEVLCISCDRVVCSAMVWKEIKLSFWYLEISWA
jgi:hypothetical protein